MDATTQRHLDAVTDARRNVGRAPLLSGPGAPATATADGDDPAAPTRALVRTARAIVTYVLSAGLRPGVADANLQLGFPLTALWEEYERTRGQTLSRSLITVQAFCRTAETQALRGDPERAARLEAVSSALRDAVHRSPWYAHLREGDRWGDVLGYQATTAASRATTVWRAIEELHETLATAPLRLPELAPAVPETPLLPTPPTAVARHARLELSGLWAAAPARRSRRPEGAEGAVEVWFGTSRRRRDGTAQEFGAGRSETLHAGRCFVHVPGAHRRGSVGSSWWQKLVRFDFRDDTLKLLRTEILDDSDTALRARIDGSSRRALLYLHGYNTSFEAAAIRAAQLAVDLDVQGIVSFFAWPSWASPAEYVPDLSQAEWSWERFAAFVGRLRAAGVEQLDVVVHSMGNRIVSWAIERLAGGGVSIDGLYMAAADLDPDILRQRLGFYRSVCTAMTLYASRGDKALALSRDLHFVGRVGLAPPVTRVDGIHSIDASRVADSFLGHGYYADRPRVLDDLQSALGGAPPDDRTGLQRVDDGTHPPYWELLPGR